MRKLVLAAVLLLLVSLSCLSASAQDEASKHRIGTHTRLQVIFADLERQWLEAVRQKDQAALNRILGDEFEVWMPAPPGDPTPRADWVKQAFGRKLQSFQLRQLAARGLSPQTAVANFVLSETFDQNGQPQTEEHFIVDVWTSDEKGENWRCTDRYRSDVIANPQPAGTQPEIKPTGKD